MRTLILASLLGLAFAPAAASHCESYTTTEPEVDTGLAPGMPRHYVDQDTFCLDLCSYWVYEEANGLDGLQRADEMVDDTCHGLIAGDKIVL